MVAITGVSDESSVEPKHKEQKLILLVSGGQAPRIINHKTHEHWLFSFSINRFTTSAIAQAAHCGPNSRCGRVGEGRSHYLCWELH